VFKYSSRFWLYAPITLVLILAAAVMIHWQMAAGTFEKKLAALKGHEAVPGITLNWDKAEVGGFPFRLDANFQNLNIAGAGAHGPFSWRSEKFAMHGLSYGRNQYVYEAAGKQQVSWTDANGGSQAISFLSGSMRGSSILDVQGLRRFDLDIVDLEATGFVAGRFQFHLRRGPADLDLMVRIDAFQPRGTKPGNLQFYATLSQARALNTLLDAKASWPRAAADWRAQGATVKFSQIVMTGATSLTPQSLLSPLY
jgi:hypothetical protein